VPNPTQVATANRRDAKARRQRRLTSHGMRRIGWESQPTLKFENFHSGAIPRLGIPPCSRRSLPAVLIQISPQNPKYSKLAPYRN